VVKSYLLFLRYALKNWLSKEKLVDESGDKVKFMVVNDGGKMVVTDIQPAQ